MNASMTLLIALVAATADVEPGTPAVPATSEPVVLSGPSIVDGSASSVTSTIDGQPLTLDTLNGNPAELELRFNPTIGYSRVWNEGIGYSNDFNVIEGFVPFKLGTKYDQAFLDFRGIWSDDMRVGANMGAGYRWYNENVDHVFGINAFYDYRDTDRGGYNQLALGFEMLGDKWDFRSNLYLPVSQDRRGGEVISAITYDEGRITDVVRRFEQAFTGGDAEIGYTISQRYRLRAFAGAYLFNGDGSENALGGRARIAIRPVDSLEFQVQVTSDAVFDTNVNFLMAVRFPRAVKGERNSRNLLDRLADPVDRLYNIELANQDVLTRTFN